MPGLLLSLFARLGVPEGLRKPLGYIGAVLAAALLLWAVVAYIRHDAVSDYKDEQSQASSEAREEAAGQRVTDAATNAANEKDLHHAIDAAPTGGALSPASLALSCERLRKRGGQLPAACGPASHP